LVDDVAVGCPGPVTKLVRMHHYRCKSGGSELSLDLTPSECPIDWSKPWIPMQIIRCSSDGESPKTGVAKIEWRRIEFHLRTEMCKIMFGHSKYSIAVKFIVWSNESGGFLPKIGQVDILT